MWTLIRTLPRLCLPLLPTFALMLAGCGGEDKTSGPAPESAQLKANTNAMEDFMKNQKSAKKK